MLISFLNDVDIQLILEFNSFGKYHPVFPKILKGRFSLDTLYVQICSKFQSFIDMKIVIIPFKIKLIKNVRSSISH